MSRTRNKTKQFLIVLAAVMAACLLLSFPVRADIASGTSGTCSWVIDDAGTLTIRPTNGVSGTLASFGQYANNVPWYNQRSSVKKVVVEKTVFGNKIMTYAFYGMQNCTAMNLSGLDTSRVESMKSMFAGCSKLVTLDASSFNTGNVTNMQSMFGSCSSLTSLNVSSFDTSKVTTMREMFNNCGKLTSLNLNSFNTNNVTSMQLMFNGCSNLTALDLSSFNTSKVTTMDSMFAACSGLTSLNISSFNTNKVTTMSSMFNGCSSLTSLNLSSFDTSNVTSMSKMFYGCRNLRLLDVSSFNTSKVTIMWCMFDNCSSLTSLNLNSFNTSNVTEMSSMFDGCSNLTSLSVDSFNTSKVKYMSSVFKGCSSLASLDLSSWDTRAATEMNAMFNNCTQLKKITFGPYISFNHIKNQQKRVSFPSIPKNAIYTGNWIKEDGTADPIGPGLMDDQSSTTLRGTWVWEEVPTKYTVKFVAPDGAAGAMENQKVKAAENWTITANAFKRFNYHFVRWRGSNGKTYTDQQTIPAKTFSPGYVLTLTAVMEKNDNHATIEDGVLDITLHGGEKITLPALPGGTKYQIWEETPAGWQLVDQLNPSGVIPANGTADASFTNEYVPGTTTVQLIATKTMDGRAPEDGAYTFRLEKDGELVQETANDGTGVVMFDTLIFRQPGDFTYTITEVRGDDPGISYDPHAETITIHVEDDGSGTLTATTAYDADGAKFVNESKPGALTVTKRTEGGGDPDEEFTFEIRLTDELGRNPDNVPIVIQ